MILAIGAFVIGCLMLLLGADKYNPTRDVIGFVLIIASFIYVAANSCG